MSRTNIRRQGINALKAAYRSGLSFKNLVEVKDYLEEELELAPRKLRGAGEWSRQAQLELAPEGTAMMWPSARQTIRGVAPDPIMRASSQIPVLLSLTTEIINTCSLAQAAVHQPDRTYEEMQTAAFLSALSPVAQALHDVLVEAK